MRRFINRLILLMPLLTVAFIFACNRTNENKTRVVPTDDQLAQINREMVIKERERIESYIQRKNIDMSSTGSGLWYSILDPGKADNRGEGKTMVLDYICELLDGTICYTGENDGYMEIVPGRSDIPPGLDEGARMLAEGAEAIFILPSYLGYGLTGDRNKIPAQAPLVYKVKVLRIY